MTKDKLIPNSQKIKKIQGEYDLTVRTMGEILSNLSNSMSERTYSNIIAGSPTTEKQMEKVMKAFKQRAKELKKEFHYKINDFFIKSFKPYKINKYLEELTPGNSFNSQISQHFTWNDGWKAESKIFKYFVSLNPKTTKLITSFLESLNEIAESNRDSENYSDIKSSWTTEGINDQVHHEIKYLEQRSKLESSATDLKENGIKIFFGDVRNFEVRPDWKLLREENKLLPVAHTLNYFLIAFCSDKTSTLEVINNQNYSFTDLRDIVAETIEKHFKKGLDIKKSKTSDYIYLRKYLSHFLNTRDRSGINFEKRDLNIDFKERELDEVKKEFSQYVKFACKSIEKISKSKRAEVDNFRDKWLKRIDEAESFDFPYTELEFDHFLEDILIDQ